MSHKGSVNLASESGTCNFIWRCRGAGVRSSGARGLECNTADTCRCFKSKTDLSQQLGASTIFVKTEECLGGSQECPNVWFITVKLCLIYRYNRPPRSFISYGDLEGETHTVHSQPMGPEPLWPAVRLVYRGVKSWRDFICKLCSSYQGSISHRHWGPTGSQLRSLLTLGEKC